MQEVNVSGVFLPAALVWAGIAFVLSALIGRGLGRTRFYDLIWHRSLFDFGLFITLWGILCGVAWHVAFSDTGGAFRP
jgi:prolipoprotein diacylglyceryltransferase